MINLTDAYHDVEVIERAAGFNKANHPIQVLDQWGAAIRDVFHDLEVNVGDLPQAKAAFAGAYLAASALIPGSVLTTPGLDAAAQLLRHLLDRFTGAV